jgi:hypothetical protein
MFLVSTRAARVIPFIDRCAGRRGLERYDKPRRRREQLWCAAQVAPQSLRYSRAIVWAIAGSLLACVFAYSRRHFLTSGLEVRA